MAVRKLPVRVASRSRIAGSQRQRIEEEVVEKVNALVQLISELPSKVIGAIGTVLAIFAAYIMHRQKLRHDRWKTIFVEKKAIIKRALSIASKLNNLVISQAAAIKANRKNPDPINSKNLRNQHSIISTDFMVLLADMKIHCSGNLHSQFQSYLISTRSLFTEGHERMDFGDFDKKHHTMYHELIELCKAEMEKEFG